MRTLTAILSLFLIAGCAAKQPAGSLLLERESSITMGRSCSLNTHWPKRLPSVAELIDSTGVQPLLTEYVETRGYLVFDVGYDSLGVVKSELPIVESDLTESTVAAIATAISSGIKQKSPVSTVVDDEQAGGRFGWSALLRIDLGESARIRIGRAEICPPKLLNRPAISQALGQEWGTLLRRMPNLSDSIPLTMEIALDSAGKVVNGILVKSSGRPEVDAAIHAVALQIEFSPALGNRRPIPAIIRIPLTLEAHDDKPDGRSMEPPPIRRRY